MATFVPNPGLLAELARDAGVVEETHKVAERVAETAREIAPVGSDDDAHPGQFQDSIHTEGNAVATDDPDARFIIFGTSRTPPHDTLRRAAELNGYRVG